MYQPTPAERLRFLAGIPLTILYVPLMLLTLIVYALMPRTMFARMQDGIRARELAARLAAMRPYVAPGSKVLDFGAGRGDFLKAVSAALGAEVIGIDIIDYSDDEIDIAMFDGATIPLPDNSVDVAMAAFVLHHTLAQEAVMRELARVSRHRIVIYEDTFFTPWQWLFVSWNDYYSNILMGSLKAWKSLGKLTIAAMPMPLTFRTPRGWQAFFGELGLDMVSTVVRHDRIKPMSKVTFVLDVAG